MICGGNMDDKKWKIEYKTCILNGNLEDAKKLILENAGNTNLFKYYRGTMLQLNTVMDGKFWLSNAKNFNDPFDSLSLVNVRTKSKYDRTKTEERELAHKEFLDQLESNKVAYQFQSNSFVTCFSEIGSNNLHMWSYYAGEHKGFCVEYSLKELIEKGISIWPVVYVDSDHDECCFNRATEGYNTLIALIKGKQWEHEKEWRIVQIDTVNSKKDGLSIDGVFPEKIYVGCRDEQNISDSWNLQKKLEKYFAKQDISKYIWESEARKISLNEVMERCEHFKSKRIPLYSMRPEEGKMGLKCIEVKYGWTT